jgi:hypothetical protein
MINDAVTAVRNAVDAVNDRSIVARATRASPSFLHLAQSGSAV